ncbi:hypothetical protein K9M59_01480 [Candidatus Gracilibacteria bacterium]|nr:hypothetical protein [Candidatus Gracilibacteria bacterium]MCF7819794.1 hypothetical protein [Candidatus Gracilibacteria bacterium]
MKRILLIGIVLVAIWLIFHESNEDSLEPTGDETTTAEEQNQEEMTDDEEAQDQEETDEQEETQETEDQMQESDTETSEEESSTEDSTPMETSSEESSESEQTEETPSETPPTTMESGEVPAEEEPRQPLVYAIDSKVKVYLYEWGIDLSQQNILPGNVEFEVVNNGQFTHHFAIEGVNDFGKVRPGEARVFTTQLLSGSFDIYSPRNIDLENGMRETLYVE